MQIDPAAHAGGRAEQSASCWFCASCSPFVQPINVSAVRKGSRGGLFNTKSIEPFSAFLSRWTSWYFWGDFDSLASLQCTSLKISLLKGSRINKEKTESCREGWWQFCARLIDVCAPPPPFQLDPLTASLQISYLDQPLPCGSQPAPHINQPKAAKFAKFGDVSCQHFHRLSQKVGCVNTKEKSFPSSKDF